MKLNFVAMLVGAVITGIGYLLGYAHGRKNRY